MKATTMKSDRLIAGAIYQVTYANEHFFANPQEGELFVATGGERRHARAHSYLVRCEYRTKPKGAVCVAYRKVRRASVACASCGLAIARLDVPSTSTCAYFDRNPVNWKLSHLDCAQPSSIRIVMKHKTRDIP